MDAPAYSLISSMLGGYNTKTGPGCSIELMKFDMGGSTAVLCATKALAKVLSFAQQRPRSLCILSGKGVVSAVTLSRFMPSSGNVTYELKHKWIHRRVHRWELYIFGIIPPQHPSWFTIPNGLTDEFQNFESPSLAPWYISVLVFHHCLQIKLKTTSFLQQIQEHFTLSSQELPDL